MAGEELSELRYHIFVCADGGDFCGCDANGGPALVGELRKGLIKRRLMPQVKVTLMNCNQPGATGPIVVVYPDAVWYDGLALDDVDEFLDSQVIDGQPLSRRLMRSTPQTGQFGK